jgi:hypothetical protein
LVPGLPSNFSSEKNFSSGGYPFDERYIRWNSPFFFEWRRKTTKIDYLEKTGEGEVVDEDFRPYRRLGGRVNFPFWQNNGNSTKVGY